MVRAPTYFGHAKFKVKNFSEFFNLQSVVYSEFLQGASGHQFFLVTSKFEVKNFSEFFPLLSALDLIFHREVWAPTFFGYTKFQFKNFSNFFHSQCALDSEFLRGGVWLPTFVRHTNFNSKIFFNFFIYTALWTLNFLSKYQLLLVMLHLRSKIIFYFFHLQSDVNALFLIGGSGHQHYLVMPNLRSKIFHNFFLYQAPWIEFFRGGSGKLFLVMQNLRPKKFFGIYLFTECSGL